MMYFKSAQLSQIWHVQDCQRGKALIRRIEDTFGMRFKEGRNPDIRFMAHLWEPLRWIHTPLAVYVGAEALWAASSLLLRALGFKPFMHPSVSNPSSALTDLWPGPEARYPRLFLLVGSLGWLQKLFMCISNQYKLWHDVGGAICI